MLKSCDCGTPYGLSSWQIFILVVHLMKWQWLFPCNVEHIVCVCMLWEIESILYHFKIFYRTGTLKSAKGSYFTMVSNF
jgi:hypothetical protein